MLKTNSILVKLALLLFTVSVFSSNIYSQESKALTESQIAKKRKLMEQLQEMRAEQIKAKIALQEKLDKIAAKGAETRQKAISSYEKFLSRIDGKKSSKASDALFQLGQLWYDQSKAEYLKDYDTYDEQIDKFQKGKIKKQPKEPEKEYKKSIKYFTQLAEDYPTYENRDLALYKLGVMYEELMKASVGLKYFMELSSKYPNSRYAETAYLRVGGYYYDKNKMDSALVFFNKVTLDGAGVENWGIAQYRIAKSNFRKANLDEARKKYFEYIVFCDQGYFNKKNFRSESIEELAQIYGELENGAQLCEEDIKVYHPGMTKDEEYLFNKIGEKAYEYDKLKNAIFAYNKLINKYPNSQYGPQAMNAIVDVYTLNKKFKEANDTRIVLVEKFNKKSSWAQQNASDPKRIVKAQTYVEKSLSLIPLYFHKLGDDTKDKQNFQTAAKYYEMYLDWFMDADPLRTYEYRFYLASCYQEISQFRKAATTFDDIVAMDISKFPMDRLKKLKFTKETAAYNSVLSYDGLMNEQIKDFESEFETQPVKDYVSSCARYLQKFPTDNLQAVEEIKVNLGATYYKGKRWLKVIEIYGDFVENNRKSQYYKQVFKNLGQAYYYGKQYKVGEEKLAQYLKDFGNEIKSDEKEDILLLLGIAIFGQGEAARDSGKIDVATKHFMRIHEVAPKSEVADIGIWSAAELYEKEKMYSKAANVFKYMQDKYPKSKSAIPALLRAGQDFEKDSLPDSAAVAYISIAEKYPDTLDALRGIYTAAKMYDSLKMYEKAGFTYEKAESMKKIKNTTRDEGLYFAGLMYEKAEKWNDAIRVYKKIESTYTKSKYLTDAIYSVALTYKQQEKWPEAADYFANFAVKYESQDPPKSLLAYMDAADCQLKLKKVDYDKAEKMLDAAMDVFEKYQEKYAISSYNAAKATFLKGEVTRARMNEAPMGGYSVEVKKGETVMEQLDKSLDEKKTELLQLATKHYASVGVYKTEEWTLKANNAIGYMMMDYAEATDKQPLKVIAKKKDEKLSLEIAIKIQVFKMNKQKMLLKASERFQVNVDYGINNQVAMPVLDTARINFPKCGYLAAQTYVEMGELFMTSPVPAELKGTEDEEYFVEELNAKKIEMNDLALPLLENVLKVCYSKGIDNLWTDKVKDKIRGINPNSSALGTEAQIVTLKDVSLVDNEYKEAIARIASLTEIKEEQLVKKILVPDLLAQLKNMQLEAKRRIEEEKMNIEKISQELTKVQIETKELQKQIFILGGGDEAAWESMSKKEDLKEEKESTEESDEETK